jgi:hypothetical protein
MNIQDISTDVLIAELERRKEEEINSIQASPLAFMIMDRLDDALKTFGSYTFGDKGPHEVMDIRSIKNQLKDFTIVEIGSILSQVLDNGETYCEIATEYEVSYLVNCIIGEFDDLPEAEFDSLFDCDDRFEY